MTKKINLITLGCSKNIVDSEHIMAQLKSAGYELCFDSNSTDAKIVIINTCGFIKDAKEESIETILSFAHAKQEGLIDRLYVIGCLSERYKKDLEQEIEEVDSFFGIRTLSDVVKELGAEWNDELNNERVLTTPSHYAYLKIAEGCNWKCGYCAIPIIRGAHISVPMEQIIEEAKNLVAKGVKEILVIAQDTSYYGVDLYGKRKLGELLRLLCKIDGIEWIRLHYAYPTNFPEDVIQAMAEEPKICKYLDIPLQHISDNQLKLMRRGINKEKSIELINKLRSAIPDLSIRTTMLVGYPNESEEDFQELLDFVRESKFERLGVFSYSEEEGTYSAKELEDNIPDEVKEDRVSQIMELQNIISRNNNVLRIGRNERVIVDRKEGDFWIARSQYDSPEVDQEILIDANTDLKVGEFYTVLITDVEDYDLYGSLVDPQ